MRSHVFGGDAFIWEMDADGGSEQRLTPAGRYPVWSPDGSRFAFIRIRTGPGDLPGNVRVMVMDANGTDLHSVGSVESNLFGPPMWSPDGSQVALNASVACGTHPVQGMAIIDVRTHEQKAVCLKGMGLREAFFRSWSSTGLIAFIRDTGSIGTMTPTGRHVGLITPKGVRARDLDWSPDGRHLVWSTAFADDEIFVMGRRGGHVRRLTGPHPFPESGVSDSGPAYSPNGERIAFERCCYGEHKTYEIFVMYADGSHLRRLTHRRTSDGLPNWQPR